MLIDELHLLSRKLAVRLEKKEIQGKTITLKVTYDDFEKITRSKTLDDFVGDAEKIHQTVSELLGTTEAGSRAIRLLGIGISSLNTAASVSPGIVHQGPVQLSFRFSEKG